MYIGTVQRYGSGFIGNGKNLQQFIFNLFPNPFLLIDIFI